MKSRKVRFLGICLTILLAIGLALVAFPAPTLAAAETQNPPTPAAPAWFGNTCIHVVQPGENLFRLSVRFGVSVSELMEMNRITDVNLIFIGMPLRVPCNVVFVAPVRFFPVRVFVPAPVFVPFRPFRSTFTFNSSFSFNSPFFFRSMFNSSSMFSSMFR